jgi:hypothetical protein
MKRRTTAASWLWPDGKCDVCKNGPFKKPGLLKSHYLGEKCRAKVFQGLNRRTDNIVRKMRAEMTPFLCFLHSTVTHQRQVLANSSLNKVGQSKTFVEFIPFALNATLLTLDVGTLHNESLAVCSKLAPLEMQLATLAASAQLWTDRWVQTLRTVPSPMTAEYTSSFEKRLFHTINMNHQIVNTSIQGCCSKSILLKTKTKQLRAVQKLVTSVKNISHRAKESAALIRQGDVDAGMKAMAGPGLMAKSYNIKFFHMLCGLRGIVANADSSGDSHPAVTQDASMHTGLKKAMSKITGISERHLSHNRLLALLKLLELQLKDQWDQGKPKTSIPQFSMDDLKPQLCSWHHSGWSTTWANYSHTMRAACLLTRRETIS